MSARSNKGPSTQPATPAKPKEPSSADVKAVADDLMSDPDHGGKPLAERMRIARGILRGQLNEQPASSAQPTGRGAGASAGNLSGDPVPRATAQKYLQAAGGDVNRARQALEKDGFNPTQYAD